MTHKTASLASWIDIAELRDQDDVTVDVKATAQECVALAERLKIPEVKDLSALVTLRRGPDTDLYRLTGEVRAEVVQECCVTLVPVPESVHETFDEVLTTSADALAADDEDTDDLDRPIELIQGGKIDLGEVVMQWLSLGLDPYPRSDAPIYAHVEAGEESGKTHKPFEVLGGLKDK